MRTALLALAIFVSVYAVAALLGWLMNRRATAALRLADLELEEARVDPSIVPGEVTYTKPQIRLLIASIVVSAGFMFSGAALIDREGTLHAVGLTLALIGVAMTWTRVFMRARIRRARLDAVRKRTGEPDAG